MIILTKEKRNKSGLDREEFGAGYDLSPDDLDVRGQNTQAKKQNNNVNKAKQLNKNNPSTPNK